MTISRVPIMIEKIRIHMENLAADLADPNSGLRRKRGLRDHPELVTRLQGLVHEMREAFVLYFRDRDEKFEYGRSGEMRMSGIPKLAWYAALLDPRTSKRLGFLSRAERTRLWDDFARFVLERSDLEAVPSDIDITELRPELPDADHHERQGENPLFKGLEQFETGDVISLSDAGVTPEETVKAAIADEIMRLKRHPMMAPNTNPLSFWKRIEPEFPYTSVVARAVLAIPATVGAPRLYAFRCNMLLASLTTNAKSTIMLSLRSRPLARGCLALPITYYSGTDVDLTHLLWQTLCTCTASMASWTQTLLFCGALHEPHVHKGVVCFFI